MSTILNIRGTNGAGKTTVVRKLLEQYGSNPISSQSNKKVSAYALKTARKTYILGRYETACGGADTIGSFAELRELVARFAAKGDVIFEGSLFSTVYKGAYDLATSLPEHRFIFALLNTPVEVCIQRTLGRRADAGNTKPFDPAGLVTKHKSVITSTARLATSGFEVPVLPYENPVPKVVGLLNLQTYQAYLREARKEFIAELPTPARPCGPLRPAPGDLHLPAQMSERY